MLGFKHLDQEHSFLYDGYSLDTNERKLLLF